MLLLQFAPNGNLEDYIKKELIVPKNEEDDITIFLQIVYGVKYLHSKDIAHRDLKPQNILLYLGDIVKIADFGLANRYEGKSMITCVGTDRYRAPEVSPRKHYDGFKSDLYSTGVIFYDILTKFSKKEPYNEGVKECLKLSDKLQEYIPDDRPSLDDVVKKFDVSDAIINAVKTSVTSLEINTSVNYFNDAIKKLLHKDLKYITFGENSCLYPEESRFVLENEYLLTRVQSYGNVRISDISKINANSHKMENNFSQFLCEITERTMNFPKNIHLTQKMLSCYLKKQLLAFPILLLFTAISMRHYRNQCH
uniref:Protein kinase domain-containing protein n=1 Tax=Panagrolaimus sp. PS1159 TaxID=55785 RepID=A0AC35G299_9BILA